jgi:uncharacterized protein
VLLLDVSGSMAPYARALLRFGARGPPERRPRGRASGGGLRVRDPADAVVLSTLALGIPTRRSRPRPPVLDWDGGTRIGACVDELVRTWGRRGVLRGAVVVICSDGLERGDPAQLAAAMARLRRQAHRVVWVNPLAGDPRFEPSQRGMAAALPSRRRLLPGHDLASLEGLSEVLAGLR